MGLTILSLMGAVLLAVLSVNMLRRSQGTAAGYFVAAIDFCLALFALFEALVSLTAGFGPSRQALLMSRLAEAALLLSVAFLFVFSLAFPRWLGRWYQVLGVLVGAGALYLGWRVVFTLSYMVSVTGTSAGIVRITGREYDLISDLGAALGVAAALIHLLRAIFTKDRIQSQRSSVSAIGTVLGVMALWVFGRAFPERSNIRWSYALMPFASLLVGGGTSYAFALSRLFDWREIGRRALGYGILTLLFGVPAGAAIAFLLVMGRLSALIPAIGSPLIFLIAYRLGRTFAENRLERLGSREYREELESGLSHVDLAEGRDAVLNEVYGLLSESLGFSDFAILIEDDRGTLRTVYLVPTGAPTQIERGSALQEHIERSGATVMLKSEALADPVHEVVRDELIALFEALKAEALVFAREGRRIIGIFALGARKTAGDYTDYDYDSFKAIYGKLFVIAYYLKNVARESILYTVDRELALSDQVVRFALEKVDPIKHPGVDSAWSTRSTRSLGGDFVDFVRISKHRWFFVLGDVSGKGLSASMNMLILKSMIRTFLRVEHDFSGLVQKVNLFIKDNLPRGTFFAGIFGYFDFERNVLYHINCGVPLLLLYSPSFNAFIEVQGEGRVLGFVRDVSPFLVPRKLALPPGSAIVAATDGVLESENLRGERFGKERLRRSIHERLAGPARQIADGVINDLFAFTDQRQEDDITLLVLKTEERKAE